MSELLHMFWGIKTVAIFDVWTFEHILSGISVGCAVRIRHHNIFKKILGKDDHTCHSWHFDMTGVLFLAFFWETIEHYLEVGLAGQTVEYWFQGVEFWPNRLIADPLMLILGYVLAKSFPFVVIPSRILSALWLLVHIFIFPHSMYLHEIF